MKNVSFSIDKGILSIKVDLSQTHGPSKSGKSVVVATTSGIVTIPGHEHIKLGLNIFQSKDGES